MCTKVYALVLMLFAAVSVYGQDNVIDEVVWVVGDEAILKSDVENERLNAQYEGRKFDGDPYCIIPEQLCHSEIISSSGCYLIVLRFPKQENYQ